MKEEGTKTDLTERERKIEEENGCDEGQCGPGWKSGGQQNQAGRRNRNGRNGQREPAGEGAQKHWGWQPKRETKKERRLGGSREGVRRDLEQKSQDPDLEIEVVVLSLHRKLELSLT